MQQIPLSNNYVKSRDFTYIKDHLGKISDYFLQKTAPMDGTEINRKSNRPACPRLTLLRYRYWRKQCIPRHDCLTTLLYQIKKEVTTMPAPSSMEKIQRAALYIRVSTQEQAMEGYSIEAQTERLTAYCKARGWNIHDIYTDPGFSGSNTQRPALQRLFSDIKEGLVDCVLVYKLDRLSRSQKDTLYMIEDVFAAHNVAFVSMNENFDTSSPFGRAMIGILSVFAQLEREQIKERSIMGRTERAKSGLWHGGGWRPIGYDYVDGHLQINASEAVIIREVYKLFLESTPLTRISALIEERYGRFFQHSAIRSMLDTPLYLGQISWDGKTYPGEHEAIIDEISFKRAQTLLADRRRIAAAKPFPFKPKHLLSGLLVCANCGASYITKGNYSGRGANKKYRPYYYCHSRAKIKASRIIDPTCLNPVYAVADLDAHILREIEHLSSDRNYFRQVFEKHQSHNEISQIEQDRHALLCRLDAIDTQLSRVIDLYQLGTISMDAIGQRTQKLQEERAALQETLCTLTPPDEATRLSENEALSALGNFGNVMASASFDEQRRLLQTLIRKIIILPTRGEFEILWNF